MRYSSRSRKFGQFHLVNGLATLAISVAANTAYAQASGESEPASKPASASEKSAPAPSSTEITEVVVVGTRASQRSSIERKKQAATATDSISAEDIGSFPDQNVNEAISRVAGIALDRGEDGEGRGISVRGNGGDLTRVEIDGMTVLNSNGALSGGTGAGLGGRAADLRELPAAMIKNIDVIKGTTAAMTEGSLGGTVHIETRNGLDFDEPFFQISADGQMNSISEEITPSVAAIFGRSFMDGRLGVTGNVNYSEFETISDGEQPQTSGNAGPFRNADFDQSPDKTFTYDPSIVDPTATAGNFRVFGPGGVPVYSSLSPIDILSQSAAAASPAACRAAFPALTTAQLNGIPAGDNVLGSVAASGQTAAQNRTAAQLEQTNGLQSCLNQWNDYAPSLIRAFPKLTSEERVAAQFRVDYQVTDDLVVYAAYQQANRHASSIDNTLNLGSPGYNQAGSFVQGTVAADSNALITPRTVNTGLGYTFNSTGLCGDPTVTGAGLTQTTTGCGVASNMSNVVVDDSHHVTSFHLNDGNANIDAISYNTNVKTWNWQTGLKFERENFRADLLYGDSGSTWERAQLRTAVNFTYGGVDAHITPSGIWSYDLPDGLDLANLPYANLNPVIARGVSNASTVQAGSPAYTAAQAAQWGNNFTLTWRPQMSDDNERQGKLDFKWDVAEQLPFVSNIQAGFQRRDHTGNGWGGGGYTVRPGTGNVGAAGYVAPIVVPTENLTVNYRSCMPTATSTQPCQYGFVPGTTVGTNNSPVANLNNSLFGTMTFTPTDLAALISSGLYVKDYPFLGDYPDKGDVMTRWPYINPNVIAAGIPDQVFDLHCMKTCTANDGSVYEQQHFAFNEVTNAVYFMFDFEQKLPWDMYLNGNIGNRLVVTKANSTGFMTLAHTAVTPAYNPVTNPGAVVTTTVALNTSLEGDTKDWLPALNLNLWVLPEELVLRYYQGRVMSRPAPAAMLPSGTCTIDERNDADVNGAGDLTNTCSGRVGNPALKPYKADNHNISLEWYPTQDLMFSVGHYRNKVFVGAPINANLPAGNLFGGNEDAVDPVTGQPFSDFDFTYPSFVNGPSGTQLGMEYSAKVAFTFLPWILRHTGVDANYSELDYENFATSRDLMTGDFNPPQGQRSYFKNFAVWYDDGKFNARVSYQGQSEFFDFISSCSNAINNYPTSFVQCPGQTIRTPYNPGGTNYREATGFYDLKMSYQFDEHWNVFLTGRNVTREATFRSTQPNNVYADGAPTLEQFTYGGARWQIGMNWRN
ncbi:MAG TPA: TonB-dependent receptor [Steroidobacteraceae bacterium]|nr:TonB-dependent receptor [Steroidobacteraceae bacterium]